MPHFTRLGTMKRTSAIVVSAIFAIIAPGTVAGIVPWWISRWKIQAPFLHFYGFRVIGVLFILLGLPVLLDSFSSISHAPSGGHGPVSLCSQPDVCSGCRLDRRPGVALGESRLTLLRNHRLDGFSDLRAAL